MGFSNEKCLILRERDIKGAILTDQGQGCNILPTNCSGRRQLAIGESQRTGYVRGNKR
jgi:hypothetical protein